MVQVKPTEISSAFHEHDTASKEKKKFLGVIEKRYARSLPGVVHAIASMLALLFGNLLFVAQVIFGMDLSTSIKLSFFISNIVSATITILFFWNKVQSWQLSTTSMQDKGLVAKQMQNFNRGRGTLALLSYSLFPVVVLKCPQDWLDSVSFSSGIAWVTLGLTSQTFLLIRDYGTPLIVVYGMFPAGVGITILRYGSISAMLQNHSQLADHFEKQAYFVLASIQFGFMWYYFYSRRLVSRVRVQTMCKNYHPILSLIYAARLFTDNWWTSMPAAVMIHSLLMILMSCLFAVKIAKTQLKRVKPEEAELRRSSLFEAEGLQSRRRSSLFEAVAN